MNTRITRRFVTIPTSFRLKEMGEEWPAGLYEVVTEEEMIGDFMYEAYRRVGTRLYLPPRPGDHGMGKFIQTDPAELDEAIWSKSRMT